MGTKDWCRLIGAAQLICWLGIASPLSAQTADLATTFVTTTGDEASNLEQEPVAVAVEGVEVEHVEDEASLPEEEDDLFGDDDLDSLLDQDLTSLRRTTVAPAFDVEVSTVSRQKSTIGRSPAAVFVITEEMIRRGTARTVPELLRMVPGLHVAHIDGSKWSISSRGFASRFSNKLLVQIDGRTVYTPLFAGVFWDIQDLLLDDIKRIEVIRGPGATIWGANAVNGVINVITKSASETRGGYAVLGGGSTQSGFVGARIGGRSEGGVDYRVSGKWMAQDNFVDPTNRVEDDREVGRVGFRTDWKNRYCDQMTLQGDWYQGQNSAAFQRPIFGLSLIDGEYEGGNILGRWTRIIDDKTDMSLQVYYDRTDRIAEGFDQDHNTMDLDFQHRFAPWQYHQVVWGLGYRSIWDRLQNNATPAITSVSQETRTLDRVSGFLQDEMTLLEDKLYLTAGTKISHNSYTELEVQPSVRMLWLPTERSAVWGAISRAVRTPHRTSEDLVLLGSPLPSPPFPPNTPMLLVGNRGMESEEVIAYEIGIRKQVNEDFAWDAAWFFNVYDDLMSTRSIVAAPPFLTFFNGASAKTYGIELSSEMQMTRNWKMRAWYSYIQIDASTDPLSAGSPDTLENSTPHNQAFIMSSWNWGCRHELDLYTRYVDNVPNLAIRSYISADLRYSWRPNRNLELSVVGQNLLDDHHAEYGANSFTGEVTTEVPRSVYGMATFRY